MEGQNQKMLGDFSCEEGQVKDNTQNEGVKTKSCDGQKQRILSTALIFVIVVIHGINNNMIGPSLMELEYITNTTTSSITAVFTWRHGGYFLGTIISGPVIDSINSKLVMGVALLGSAIATGITPMWRNLLGLFVTSGLGGIAVSFITVCISATLLTLWTEKVGPFLQAQFFLVTLGGALSPQLLKPFFRETLQNNTLLVQKRSHDLNSSEFTAPLHGHLQNQTISYVDNDTLVTFETLDTESQIQWCFALVAVAMATMSLINITFFASEGCKFKAKKNVITKSHQTLKIYITGKSKFVILLMFFLQSFMFGGMEDTLSSLLMTFAVRYLEVSNSIGTDMTTVLWLSVTISRGLGIIISKYIRATKLLAFQLVTLLAVNLTLTFAIRQHWIVPWVCIALVGLCSGSILPNLLSWANDCIHLKGKETAVFLAGASFSKMICIPLIGYLFDKHEPLWFIYMILIYTSVFIVLYIANLLLVYVLKQKEANRSAKEEEIEL